LYSHLKLIHIDACFQSESCSLTGSTDVHQFSKVLTSSRNARWTLDGQSCTSQWQVLVTSEVLARTAEICKFSKV